MNSVFDQACQIYHFLDKQVKAILRIALPRAFFHFVYSSNIYET